MYNNSTSFFRDQIRNVSRKKSLERTVAAIEQQTNTSRVSGASNKVLAQRKGSKNLTMLTNYRTSTCSYQLQAWQASMSRWGVGGGKGECSVVGVAHKGSGRVEGGVLPHRELPSFPLPSTSRPHSACTQVWHRTTITVLVSVKLHIRPRTQSVRRIHHNQSITKAPSIRKIDGRCIHLVTEPPPPDANPPIHFTECKAFAHLICFNIVFNYVNSL